MPAPRILPLGFIDSGTGEPSGAAGEGPQQDIPTRSDWHQVYPEQDPDSPPRRNRRPRWSLLQSWL